MAKTVTVKSTRYTSAKKGMPTGQAPTTVAPGVTVEKVVSKTKGGANVTTITTVDGNVFGKVEYDLNSARNGVWLPSNNAIFDWRRGTNAAFKSEYARRAMHSANPPRQFHDAHKAYSDKIIEHLGEMDAELKKRAEKCVQDDHKTADENKKLPAPRILLIFLNSLSSVLKHKLVGPPSGWRAPYNTSARALSDR